MKMNRSRTFVGLGLAVLSLWALKQWRRAEPQSMTFSTWSPNGDMVNKEPALQIAARTPQNETAQVAKSAAPRDARPNLDEKLARMTASTAPLPQVRFQELPKTAALDVNGRPYQILGVMAVPRNKYILSMGPVLLEQGGFQILAVAPTSGDAWKQMTLTSDGRPAVLNPSNGQLSVVTGTLEVKLKSLEDVSAISDRENLRVLSVDEQINTVYYSAPDGYALVAGLQRLQAMPEVDRVQLELYSGRKEAR